MLYDGVYPPKHYLKNAALLEFVQLLSRVAPLESQNHFSKLWYPEVDTSLMYFNLKNQALLLKYVLHAKHRRIDADVVEKLEACFGDEFADVVARARPFII